MKKILSFVALAAVVAFSSCSDDDEKLLTCNFNGMLTEAESEYLSVNAENKTDESTQYGSVFSSTFTDKTGTFVFNSQCADWSGNANAYAFSGGFTYTNKTDVTSAGSIAAVTGKGVDGNTYMTGFSNGVTPLQTTFANGASYVVKSAYFTNAAYSYLSMKNGDTYAKQFTEEDWYKLTLTGSLAGQETGTAEIYLAKDGKIEDSWLLADLAQLGKVDKITFSLSSSDNGQFGMNTPAYFCMDKLTVVVE